MRASEEGAGDGLDELVWPRPGACCSLAATILDLYLLLEHGFCPAGLSGKTSSASWVVRLPVTQVSTQVAVFPPPTIPAPSCENCLAGSFHITCAYGILKCMSTIYLLLLFAVVYYHPSLSQWIEAGKDAYPACLFRFSISSTWNGIGPKASSQ